MANRPEMARAILQKVNSGQKDEIIKIAQSFKGKALGSNTLSYDNIAEDEGTVDAPIGRNPNDRKKMSINYKNGKRAVTHYKVLERLQNQYTYVECSLETGRTHQIRVHMKHIGHVLFNDERYGGNEILKGTHFSKYKQFVNNCFEICPRQALHAKTLGFVHPKTGEEMFFTSELPKDMTELIEKWRTFAGGLT